MAAGSSSQKKFRKALAAIKDSTSVGIAKVNSENRDLTVSILKATNHLEVLPKEKYVRFILGAVSGSRRRTNVVYCIQTLIKRLYKTHCWAVALKTLIVIHRALREVDQSFCEELIYFNRNRGQLLSLYHFNDDSSPAAWDYSAWIRAYAIYIGEYLECFRVLKYDFHREHSRAKRLDTPVLLDQIPALQQLLFCLLNCQPAGAAKNNFMIQHALSIIALESVRLYVAITDGLLILVDKFFEMQRQDAVRVLEIYRRAVDQATRLSEFFELCRRLNFGRSQKYITIEQLPVSFLAAMDEHINNSPQTFMAPRDDDDDTGDSFSKGNSGIDPDLVNTEEGWQTYAAPSLIPDLLSWDERTQETFSMDNNISISTPGLDDFTQSDNWELMLVSEANPDEGKSAVGSLWHAPLARSTNPFEDDNYSQKNYDWSFTMHPCYMDQQTNQIPTNNYMLQQWDSTPHLLNNYQLNQNHFVASYDYVQVAGISESPLSSSI